MKGIQTCLWFDTEAEEAAKFYASVFRNVKIGAVVPYGKAGAQAAGRPEGSVMTVDFEIEGLPLLGLNGGPVFKLNPSVSFFVGCESAKEIDELWGKLSKVVRMPLQQYPFADRYGWCEDRFGVNWQLIYSSKGPARRQKVCPSLLFANEKFGKAEEAINFYIAALPDSRVQFIAHDEKTKAVLHSVVTLAGRDFVIMEGPGDHQFQFSPAMSFIARCESQEEIDRTWSKLSAVPEAEQCGWLQDRYGVSWQILHRDWGRTFAEADAAKRERLMAAVLTMKKPDWKKLQSA